MAAVQAEIAKEKEPKKTPEKKKYKIADSSSSYSGENDG